MAWRDDFEDDEDVGDEEDPDSVDANSDDSVDTRPCPYCGKPVYEQAELCPHCRSYISREDVSNRRWPWWVWAGIVLAILGSIPWLLLR